MVTTILVNQTIIYIRVLIFLIIFKIAKILNKYKMEILRNMLSSIISNKEQQSS